MNIKQYQSEYDILSAKLRRIETVALERSGTLFLQPDDRKTTMPLHQKMHRISETLEKQTRKVVTAHGRSWVIYYVAAFHGWVFTKYPRSAGMLSDPQPTFDKALSRLEKIEGWGRSGARGLK